MNRWLQKLALAWLIAAFSLFFPAFQAQAKEGSVLGVHILHPDELDKAKELVSPNAEDQTWNYVTIPFSLDDLEKKDQWQAFFDQAKNKRVIPLVRLVSRFENGSWQVPNRKQTTDQIKFLSKLEWPTDKKHIIVFNEVNHAPEWGGRIDPESYAKVLLFTAQWAHATDSNFVVLPAAMDLAAPNGSSTMEAFNYLDKMLAAEPDVFKHIDAWNSHSYPNPGFSSSPQRTTKNSLRGFEHELAYLKQKIGKDDYPVYITETGWVANGSTRPWLESYYTYAMQHVWSHPQVVAVTPFVLQGDPGPFSGFAFIDRNSKPTVHYTAFQNAIKKIQSNS
jgi:hypothetical protein